MALVEKTSRELSVLDVGIGRLPNVKLARD
jgi:hypothetical protein